MNLLRGILATLLLLLFAAIVVTCSACAHQPPRPKPPIDTPPNCQLIGYQSATGIGQPPGMATFVLREVRDWTYLCPMRAAPEPNTQGGAQPAVAPGQ